MSINLGFLASMSVSVGRIVQNMIYKKQNDKMDALAENPDLDLPEARERLEYLRDLFNREMPKKEDNKFLPFFNKFIKESGVDDDSKRLAGEIAKVVDNDEDLRKTVDEIKNIDNERGLFDIVNTIKRIITNLIKKLVGVIVSDYVTILHLYTDEQIAEAVATYLDEQFEFSPILEFVDKTVFKVTTYVTVMIIRKFVKEYSGEDDV